MYERTSVPIIQRYGELRSFLVIMDGKEGIRLNSG